MSKDKDDKAPEKAAAPAAKPVPTVTTKPLPATPPKDEPAPTGGFPHEQPSVTFNPPHADDREAAQAANRAMEEKAKGEADKK